MKKLIVGALVLCVAMSGIAQRPANLNSDIEPRWLGAEVGEWTMDYEAAFAASATNENSRGVILYFTGMFWCPWCKALEEKVLLQDEWNDYVRDNNLYLAVIDNPARNGTGNWCWLWEPDYQEKNGLTDEEARQVILDRYALQTQYAAPGAALNAFGWGYYQIGYPTFLFFRPGDRDRAIERYFPDVRDYPNDGIIWSVEESLNKVIPAVEQAFLCDDEDGADKWWQGATLLDVGAAGSLDFGSRTLSAADDTDWYKFESGNYTEWRFFITPGTRGATNDVALAIYSDPSGSALVSQTLLPADGASFAYTTTSAGTYYLRVARSGDPVLQGYHLGVTRGDSLVGALPLTVGVQAMAGPFTLEDVPPGATVVASVKNGKLPSGLSVVVLDGAAWITGVPKAADAGKTGEADLILSVRLSSGTVQDTILRISWTVAPLGRVAGQYNGFRFTAEDEAGYGNVTMTVTAAGKISGKFLYEGTQYTFAAPRFDMVDATGHFGATNILAKAGKSLMSVSLSLGTAATQGMLTIDGAGGFLLYRNNWADAAPMGAGDALANYVGYYTAALPVASKSSDVAPAGTGYLTITTGAKGTVKYAGLPADGKSVSGSTVLLYGPDCCSAEDRLMFYLLTPVAKNNSRSVLYGGIQLLPGASKSVADVTLVPAHAHMTWFSANPASVYGYAGASSEGVLGFTNTLNVVGGFYAKNTSLVGYYGAGKVLSFAPLFGAPLDFDGERGASGFSLLSLPDAARLPMAVTAAAKLAAPAQSLVKNGPLVDCEASVNPWGMTLAFKPATGVFTASSKAYYQNSAGKQKTKTLAVKGVFVPRRASYDDPTDWFGFYLVSDKCNYQNANGKSVSYSFGWSYDVRLGVAPDPAP